MATLPAMPNDRKKPSFAKVAAASAPKDFAAIAPIVRSSGPAAAREKGEPNRTSSAAHAAVVPDMVPVASHLPKAVDDSTEAERVAKLGLGKDNKDSVEVKSLEVETKAPSLIVNGSSSSVERPGKLSNSQTPSDDTSQRADSSSELGTKPPSLDGKSITSGTTFALDEKESLRPDDSASVKAAAEDDDAFSVRGSYIPSRMGSDLAARFRSIQIGDMPLRPPLATHVAGGSHGPGIATPQSGSSDKNPLPDSKPALAGGVTAPESLAVTGYLSQNPDEKLLEAMRTSKDRLFLLRLEQQVIEFVQDSKEPFMDLPPSNSFCRMLTHKLADYYHMTHSFEPDAGAVRIFRTPFCRIPPSLSSIATNTSTSSSPGPAVLPRKIMKRGGDGENATTSASPSKPTSEVGSDSKDKNIPKEKLTREEREEAYNKARQRIFGNLETTENATSDGDANGVSRASSVSAKDKSNVGKRKANKQRRDDSESFDSRSQYVVWSGPQQVTWAAAGPQYFPANGAAYNAQFPQQFPQGVPAAYPPNQGYPPMLPNNGYAPQYPNYGAYPVPAAAPQPLPAQPQAYQPPNPPIPAPFPGPAPNALRPVPNGMPPQNVPQQAWSQQSYNPNAFPPTRGSPTPAVIPYAYGQLPANANPNDPKSQHPIPGSYSRQNFNPKSQTFVPTSGGMAPMPPAPNPYGNASPHHGSPQFQSPHLGFGAFQQPPMLPPGYQSGPVAFPMARQGSNNSLTQFHPGPPQPPMGPQHLPPNVSPHIPNKPMVPQGAAGQGFGHLPNYGNPASLPQKPT